VALSVSVTGPRPLAGTLPCGDRTFLPRFQERLPIRQLLSYCLTLYARICIWKHFVKLTKLITSFEMDGLSCILILVECRTLMLLSLGGPAGSGSQ